jgi:Trypsin
MLTKLAGFSALAAIWLMLSGMIGGVPTEVPTEGIKGLVTLEFGPPSNRNGCSGVLYKQWVITAAHCNNGSDIRASMFGGGSVQQIKNIPANVVQVALDDGTLLLMVRLGASFIDRGEAVSALATLDSQVIAHPVGTSLQCYGRGDWIDAPNGDPSAVSGDTPGITTNAYFKYRSAEFKVININFLPKFTVGYGEFGEKMARGDSGGPCFLVDPTTTLETQQVVGFVNDTLANPPKTATGNFTFLGTDIYPVASLVTQIESVIANGPPTPFAAHVNLLPKTVGVRLINKIPKAYKVPKRPPPRALSETLPKKPT